MPYKIPLNHIPDHQLPPSNEEKITFLKNKILELETICKDLNPYQPISAELKLKLRQLNIYEFDDPFKMTNALLILLEDAIDELHQLEPLHDHKI